MKMMKRIPGAAFLVALMLSLFSCGNPVPDKEMPITTSSDEARTFFLQGRDFWDASQASKAAELFDKAIEADPGFAQAYFYRATSGGGNDVYVANLDKAFSLMDQVSEGEQVFLKIFLNERDGNGEAMNMYADSLLNMYPEDKRIPYIIGVWNLNGDVNENDALLKKSLEIDENFAPAYSVLADNYSYLKDFEQAEKYAQRYLELVPDKAEPYQRMGTLYRQEGKFEAAIEMYKKMLEVDPESQPYVYIGNCYVFMGDFTKAREYYMKHINNAKLIDFKLSGLMNNCISYIFEGDEEGALESMVKYREEAENAGLTSSVINSYLYPMAIAWAFDDYSASEEYLNQALDVINVSELDQTQREGYERNANLWRGYLLIGKGELDQAEEYTDLYMDMAKERSMPGEIQGANLNYGMIALKRGEFDKALSFLKESGESYDVWFYLGETHLAMGDTEVAKAYFEKIATSNLVSMDLALVRNKAIQRLKDL
jgi:tetratricopeptide (TPR) repeat protein